MMTKLMLKKSDGVALVELAIILPLILILGLGVFEIGRAIHAKNIITNMSREGANLASRTSRTSTTAQQIMDSIALTAQPLDMTSNGMIFITEVRGQGAYPTVPRVKAQHRWTGGNYQPSSRTWSGCSNWDADGACLENFDELTDDEAKADLNGLELKDGEVVFAVEVFYDYKPIITYVFNHNLNLYSQTVF